MKTLEPPAKQETLSMERENQKAESLSSGKHLFNSGILKFFASVKLAIIVLATLMAVLATGTIIESLHGTDAARILIYESPWFSLVLLVLGINLAFAAVDRYPWKIKHTGFVITHAGIILILIGSFMTQRGMIDGQMPLAEGETDYRISLPEPLLYIFSEKEQTSRFVNLKKQAFPWQGREAILKSNDGEALPFQLFLTAYYPKARMQEAVLPSPNGQPAVQVHLHNDFVDQTQWLIKNNEELGKIQMGPATLRFADELLAENAQPQAAEASYLEFQFQNKNVPIPLKPGMKLPAEFALEGTPYRIKIVQLLKNAVVEGKELVEDKSKGDAAQNPAAQLILIGKDLEEQHTVFANFPDFQTIHGMKPSAAGVRIFYRQPHAGSRGESHEIRFVVQNGKLLCQIQEGIKVSTHEVKTGEAIPTGWMGNLTVTAEAYEPSAEVKRSFTPEANTSESKDVTPAIQVEIENAGESKSVWLRQGVRETVTAGGAPLDFIYGEKRMPLGFKLTLREFRMEQYPGTENPAAYESDVTLKDDSRGVVKNVTVSMNKPLLYRGFRIYQSGYSLPSEPGESKVSIFAVGKDPGVPVKYLGAIVMVIGVITMFYFRRFSATAEKTL